MITLKYKLTQRDLYEYVIQVLLKKLLMYGSAISVFGIFFFTVITRNTTLLVVALICLAATVLVSPMTVWEIQRNAKISGSKEDSETTLTFDQTILMQEDKIRLEVEYSQVMKICETKHLYVLLIGKKNGIVIPKSAIEEPDFNTIRFRIFDSLVSDKVKNSLAQLKAQGKTVEAVRFLRQNTTLDLLGAKQYIDAL